MAESKKGGDSFSKRDGSRTSKGGPFKPGGGSSIKLVVEDKRSEDKSDPDLASDPSFLWRFIKTTVSAFGNDVGKIGYTIGPVQDVLRFLDDKLGTFITSQAVNGLAALIQEPQWLKNVIKMLGWPEQVNALADEFIDDVFEGLRMAHRGKIGEAGKITEAEAVTALDGALDRLRLRQGKQKSFLDARMLISAVQRQALDDKIIQFEALGADQKKRWSDVRSLIDRTQILEDLAARDVTTWTSYFDISFGRPKPPDTTAVTDRVGKLLTTAEGVVKKVLGPPPTPAPAQVDPDWYDRLCARKQGG